MHLIVRPAPDALTICTQLAAHGLEALPCPVSRIEMLAESDAALRPLANKPWAGLLATSRHALPSLSPYPVLRRLPLLTVGDATANAARSLGFLHIESAEGDAASLSHLLLHHPNARAGEWLYVSGRDRAHDMTAGMAAHRVRVHTVEVYANLLEDSLPQPARTALQGGTVKGALFFSARTAAHFTMLIQEAGMLEILSSMDAFCLSTAIAETLTGTHWKSVRVASTPTTEALLEMLHSPFTIHDSPSTP